MSSVPGRYLPHQEISVGRVVIIGRDRHVVISILLSLVCMYLVEEAEAAGATL